VWANGDAWSRGRAPKERGESSAVGARIDTPREVGFGERVSRSPPKEGFGEEVMPPPQKIFQFFELKNASFGALWD